MANTEEKVDNASSAPGETFHDADLTRGMEHMRFYVQVENQNSEDSQQGNDVYGVPASVINPTRRPAQTDADGNPLKRSDPFQFGTRMLEEGDDIFKYNAWDHVEVDPTFMAFAEEQFLRQKEDPVSERDRTRINSKPEQPWNKFYSNHEANFFKNRKWLFQEFPVLAEATAAPKTAPDGSIIRNPVKILEIGAGAGNTAFPILTQNHNPNLKLHACDFSSAAVEVMRRDPAYNQDHMQADVWDLGGGATGKDVSGADGALRPSLPPNIEPGTVDIALLVFTFSALAPDQWKQALLNVWTLLKPGGKVLFRDYGRGDLAQVRFKKGRWLGDNFYIRGDDTRVYFFEEAELRDIWQTGGNLSPTDGSANADRPAFEVVHLGADRRMLVNRKRKLKMYRCWMQGLFQKPQS